MGVFMNACVFTNKVQIDRLAHFLLLYPFDVKDNYVCVCCVVM